ncbi:MAG TPA: helix-turn-helix domain-containing protein [Caulobacteraceae bacterium]|nr:helix-turn-helix domain-containing protein [Caulobacteraceae bacterium]
MTRYDIADYIGASSEVVIRGLGRLEAMDLIRRLSPRTLEVKTTELKAFVNLPDH